MGETPLRLDGDVVDIPNDSNCCVKSMSRFVVSPSLAGDRFPRRGVGDEGCMLSGRRAVPGVLAPPARGVMNSIVFVGLRCPSFANTVMSTLGTSENVLKQVSSMLTSSWMEKDVVPSISEVSVPLLDELPLSCIMSMATVNPSLSRNASSFTSSSFAAEVLLKRLRAVGIAVDGSTIVCVARGVISNIGEDVFPLTEPAILRTDWCCGGVARGEPCCTLAGIFNGERLREGVSILA